MKVLVFCKPSNWAKRSTAATEQHRSSVKKVHNVLGKLKISYEEASIEKDIKGYDLVITVGGDGTLLYASHYVDSKTPILAINSAPDHSEGFFCGCNGDNFIEIAEDLIVHKYGTQTEVTRMKITINSNKVNTVYNRVLNDVLYCHANPALTTRYSIAPKNEIEENQMSSGIWFSTAVGSTAAIRSAGGFTMPHDNSNIQYIVREPYQPRGSRYQNIHGFLRPDEYIKVIGHVNNGWVNIDGAHIKFPVRENDTLTVQKSDEPLTLINFRN